jgi:hypothetical protein
MCTFLYGGNFSKEVEALILEYKLDCIYDGDFCYYAKKLPENFKSD